MKSMLLITIVFPPEGGGGTIRVAKNAKYLPENGWRLSVITSNPPKGVSGKAEFPHVNVYRAPRLEVVTFFSRVAGVARGGLGRRGKGTVAAAETTAQVGTPALGVSRRRLADYVFIPDERVVWAPLAFLKALWSMVHDSPQVIYSTSPSPSTHLVGYLLAVLTRLPWVIEFRDPWMFNPFRNERPFKWMERLEGYLEKKVLHRATHVVVTSEEYKRDFLARYPDLSPERLTFIPNGYDAEDFAGIVPERFDRFTIVHTGAFYHARSPVPFMEGVALALELEPSLRRRFQVIFAGPGDELAAAAVERLLLKDVVMHLGVVPHRKSIELAAGADLLLLVPGPGEGTMPGKTYEYLAVKKPILALCETGVVSRLVASTGSGSVVAPQDVEGIARAILVHCGAAGAAPVSLRDEKALQRFERREIARETAALLERLVAGETVA